MRTRAPCWVVAFFALAFAATEARSAEPRHVLLLYTLGSDFAPWSESIASFREEMDKKLTERIEIFEASIFADRLDSPPEQAEARLIEYLSELFSSRKLDLVVTVGAPAAQFVKRHRQDFFANTPAVFGAADPRIIGGSVTVNDTVVGFSTDLPGYIENILRVRPETKSIAVAIGSSSLERYWLSEMQREFQPFLNRVNFTWWNDLSFDEMLKRAAALAAETAILYQFVMVDAAGASYPRDRVFAPLRSVATAPIFGYGDFQLGRGIIGGPLAPMIPQGKAMADAVVRILRGERPSDLKYPLPYGPPSYDWRELRRWNISEALLPPDSIVQFREPTVLEKYRWQILLITTALLVQTLLIAGLVSERRRRHRAEVESRRRMGELALMNRRSAIGEMSASIAHEIRQPLTAIVANGDAALAWLASKTPDLKKVVEILQSIVDDGMRANQVVVSVRGMFKKDIPASTLVDLNDVIREVLMLLHVELAGYGVAVRTSLGEGLPHVLADRVQMQQVILNLIRNAVEAMSSTAADDRNLWIRSAATDARESIVAIEDSGPGIDSETLERIFEPFFTTKGTGMGMGLSICRSIVETHGGRLTVAPARSHGSIFQIVLPQPR